MALEVASLAPLVGSRGVLSISVDSGSRDNATAEHVLHEVEDALGLHRRPSYVASTHVVRGEGSSHVALALSWEGLADAPVEDLLRERLPSATGSAQALAAHLARSSGRLTRFRGQHDIEGRISVAEVLRVSLVDEVRGLAGVEVEPDTVLQLGDFARPTWERGRCVLLVQPATNGLIPFEVRHQIPCCAAH